MECPVCYEKVTEDNCQDLECSHSLCKLCLSRLHQRICPLCRAPITFSYVQRLLPAVEDTDEDNEWESTHSYEFEFSVEVRIPHIQRRRRRRRRERNRVRDISDDSVIPVVVSEVHMAEILLGVSITTEDDFPLVSKSDRYKQKVRQGRNRWKSQNRHTFANRWGN
jgi:hypothetical protein